MDKKFEEEIRQVNSMLQEFFDEAWKCNNNDKLRTDFTKKCTTYIPRIQQTLGYMEANFTETEKIMNEIRTASCIFPAISSLSELGKEWYENIIKYGEYVPAKKEDK